jgi:uncharacterized protein (DUF169 family)
LKKPKKEVVKCTVIPEEKKKELSTHIRMAGDRVSFSELSERLKTVLELEGSPVGVKLIKVGEKLPSIAESEKPMPYCASIAQARKGKTILLGKDKFNCKLGAANLGLIAVPEMIASGKAHASMGLFKSTDAASKTISQVPRIDPETIQATLVFPLEKAPMDPDVVIFHVKPINGMWIAFSLTYTVGGRISSSFSGLGGTCGDVTVLPYLTNKPNFTVGDFYARKYRSPEEIIIGLPAALLEEVVNNLEKLPVRKKTP